jgi:hypothetical protein
MDTTICGLNKVVCRASSGTVTITNGVLTWSKAISSGKATFYIPSTPAPAKKTYTVTIGGYSRNIELGFGDSLDITLDAAHEFAIKQDITSLQSQLTALATRVSALETKANVFKSRQMVTANKSGSTLYLTSFTPYN